MKSFKLILLSSFLLILSISHGQGSGDLILVREDIVKPYLADEYEYALMDLAAHFAENGEKDIRYITHIQDNFHYTHLSEIDHLDDIQSCMFACTHGKEKSAECSLIFEVMHKAVEPSRAYIVELDEDLSYIPDDE